MSRRQTELVPTKTLRVDETTEEARRRLALAQSELAHVTEQITALRRRKEELQLVCKELTTSIMAAERNPKEVGEERRAGCHNDEDVDCELIEIQSNDDEEESERNTIAYSATAAVKPSALQVHQENWLRPFPWDDKVSIFYMKLK